MDWGKGDKVPPENAIKHKSVYPANPRIFFLQNNGYPTKNFGNNFKYPPPRFLNCVQLCTHVCSEIQFIFS